MYTQDYTVKITVTNRDQWHMSCFAMIRVTDLPRMHFMVNAIEDMFYGWGGELNYKGIY